MRMGIPWEAEMARLAERLREEIKVLKEEIHDLKNKNIGLLLGNNELQKKYDILKDNYDALKNQGNEYNYHCPPDKDPFGPRITDYL